jgi:tRNA pseudouridine38-40 synthase
LCKITPLRYFLEFSYKGTAYHGWQRQPNAVTVQQQMEDALSTLLGKETAVLAAGRTDTGVHAKQMFAHVDLSLTAEAVKQLAHRLNKFLPQDIAIVNIHPVKADAHARFDAISRSYAYHLVQFKHPFAHELAYTFTQPLDWDAMNAAAKLLLSHTNFKCFSRSKTDVKTYDCKVTEAYWTQSDSEWIFHISANRFLRNMVRAIVGTLLDVGTGKSSLADFQAILDSEDRTKAGSSAPAQGLFLTQVQYPNTIFETNG